MTTYMAKPQEVESKWYVIDATDKVLGRLATEAARLLRGKHKPTFTPHVDTGDHVIIINAEKVLLTGQKLQQKQYIHYTGYPGGLRTESAENLMRRNSAKVIEIAVKGMIPHNRLGSRIIKKLKVYAGAEHPHQAQQPEPWNLPGSR
jgi:large subunit ribosomal protein L13